MKNKKGITLVALIITIIVMIILAGVSISLVSGDNGILNKAEVAGEKQNYATLEERIKAQCEYITQGENAGKVNLSETESNIIDMELEEIKNIIPSPNLLTVELNDGSKIEIEGIYIEDILKRIGLTSENVIYNKRYETEDGMTWFIINSDGSFDSSWAGSFSNETIEEAYKNGILIIEDGNRMFTSNNDGTGGGFVFESGNKLYLYAGVWDTSDLNGSIIKEENFVGVLEVKVN